VNYAFSHGESITAIGQSSSNRGMFCRVKSVRISQGADGLSNTIAMSERLRVRFGAGDGFGNLGGRGLCCRRSARLRRSNFSLDRRIAMQ
jgi:hypothetical protein